MTRNFILIRCYETGKVEIEGVTEKTLLKRINEGYYGGEGMQMNFQLDTRESDPVRWGCNEGGERGSQYMLIEGEITYPQRDENGEVFILL